MRLLVIGGYGFLGCNFIRYVLGHYHAEFITNVDAQLRPSNHQNLHEIPDAYGDRYEYFQTDVGDTAAMDKILALHRYFAVVYFASENSHPHMPALIASAAAHHVKRFVHVTSLPPSACDYAATMNQHSNGIETVSIHGAGVYGPNQWAMDRLPTWMRCTLEGVSPMADLPPNGSQEWLHVNDFCASIMAVMLEGVAGANYVAGPDHSLKNSTVERWIRAAIERRAPLAINEEADLAPALTDSSRIRSELDWHPILSPQERLRAAVQWYLHFRARLLP